MDVSIPSGPSASSEPALHEATPKGSEGYLARARNRVRARAHLADPIVDLFVDRLRRRHGEAIVGIVFYGSCLSVATRQPTSFYDFFVVVDSYAAYHDQLSHRLLGPILAPSVFFSVFPAEGDDPALRCKYGVISLDHLRRETGSEASDVHVLGRFSKRVAVVWARDDEAFDELVECAFSAVASLVPRTLVRLSSTFTLEEMVLAQLGISYEGEQRIRETSKVRALYQAEQAHYLALFSDLLAARALSHGDVLRDGVRGDEGESFGWGTPPATARFRQQRPAAPLGWLQEKSTDFFLWKSRLRGRARWPKYVFTVDNRLDIVLDKVERHNGIHLELTALERRWPLIFGWGKFFRLMRQGVIR